jgi:uncharacterized GH25 family protein
MSFRATHAVAALVALALASGANAGGAKLAIQGRVVDPAARPIAGAKVYVYTAAPRLGVGSACPSCYPECGKSATTDKKGRFAFAGLSDQLLYRLLFVAEDRTPEFRDRVDPVAGAFDQVLRSRDTVLAAGLHATVGHVVDSRGQPVAGASVFPRGMQVDANGVMFGSLSGINARIDPVAITDADGEFRLIAPDSVQVWVLHVEARNLSPRVFPDVTSHGVGTLLELDPGANVTGVVLRDGQPVPGAVIGMSQVDRDAMSSVDPDTIAADERGRFTFSNVPASQDYCFSGVIGSMGPWALRSIVRTVGEDDSTTTLPPLAVEPGYRLQGRVSLSDGQPVPAGTELVLNRAFAPGTTVVPMDADGRFSLDGLPPETVSLKVRIRGYRIVPSTPGYVGKYGASVRIAMLRDREDVEIVLEPTPTRTAAGTSPRP